MDAFNRPSIMGIINCTPDSFYTGSRSMEHSEIAGIAEKMIRGGADIIDIGGESTRPGAVSVDASEQIARVLPAIRLIRDCSSVDISIDTQSSVVAEAALDAGATIINDVSALRADPRMADLAAERNVPVILMHMQGSPATMQNNPHYDDVVLEVRDFFLETVDQGISKGIRKNHIILDPGIGFGKRFEDNVSLLRNLPEIRVDELPLLVGLSRKSFLGTILGSDADRLAGTLAAHGWCLAQGIDFLRVHDVRETRDFLDVWEALACDSS